MTNKQLNFPFHSTYLYDQECLPQTKALLPFALTDILTEYAQINQQPIIHFWQLYDTVILGMKDTKIPALNSRLAMLKKKNYHPIVRNSGGLGVVCDTGVLNVTLFVPQSIQHKYTIDQAYYLIYLWMKLTFETPTHPIKAFEVTQSYCPGTFDLSINNKKFAGIAQRRIKNGIAIMIYLSVNGKQENRSKLMQQFYASQTKTPLNDYPIIDPSCMENLDILLDQPLTIKKAKKKLIQTFKQSFSPQLDNQKLTESIEQQHFTKQLNQQLVKMVDRNKVLTEI